MNDEATRRAFLVATGGALLLTACPNHPGSEPAVTASTAAAGARAKKDAEKAQDEEVGALEDLAMREHGVIRRVLVVYRESAMRLRTKPASIPPEALQKAARLVRTFGEDHHEREREEPYVFPVVQAAAGPAAGEISTLLAQHRRGREITDWILSATQGAIGATTGEPLARALEDFARMYEEHAAREDTLVFPAWKAALSKQALADLGQQFATTNKTRFGKDGFEDAVEQAAAIERAIGLDPATFLPPTPQG